MVTTNRITWVSIPVSACAVCTQCPRSAHAVPTQCKNFPQDSRGGYRPLVVCTALCVHRLVCAPPNLPLPQLASLDAGAKPRTPAYITRLLRWLQTAFCVHRLVYAPPSVCIALCVNCQTPPYLPPVTPPPPPVPPIAALN